jgi:hypothetical protein
MAAWGNFKGLKYKYISILLLLLCHRVETDGVNDRFENLT